MIQELDVQKIRKDFPMLQNQNLIYLAYYMTIAALVIKISFLKKEVFIKLAMTLLDKIQVLL